jgi:hypothetical protein
MSQLVIEYVFEGHHRGYNFTSSTDYYDDEILKSIWRNAMPRGQGWGDALYHGARSIKAFQLPDGRVAVSEVTVTDLADESGRRGIRRAVIDVMTRSVFHHHLQSRLAGYPQGIRAGATLKRRELERSFPRLKRGAPLILAHPFRSSFDWWIMEALIIDLAARPPSRLQNKLAFPSFTTLALTPLDGSQIVAIPQAKSIDEKIPIAQLK